MTLKQPSLQETKDGPTRRDKKHKVFISYSHQDIDYLSRLMVHLKPIEKLGLLDIWVDTKLRAGDLWKLEISKALADSEVAILLVSADFLASDFIVDNELPPLLEGAQREGTRIIPIILKACRFSRDNNLKSFQAINDPETPLSAMDESTREKTYDKLAKIIEEIVSG